MNNTTSPDQLKRNITIGLIALQVITVAVILLVFRFATENVLKEQASTMMRNAAQESMQHTRGFLRPANRTVLSATDLLSSGALASGALNIRAYFLSKLSNNPEFVGIYLADPNGGFHYVSRQKSDNGTLYREKRIFFNSGEKQTEIVWFDENFKQIGETEIISDEYNALTRPWYKVAIQNDSIVWTDPYQFFTSKETGITISAAIRHNDSTIKGDETISGVLGVDVELTDISDFLAKLNLGNEGLAAILDPESNLIAISDDSVRYDLNATNLLPSQSEKGSVVSNMVNLYSEKNKQIKSSEPFSYQVDKTEYLASFIPLELDAFAPKWTLAVFAPKGMFLERARIIERKNILVALSILLLSLSVVAFIIFKVWRPIKSWQEHAYTDQLSGLHNRHYVFTNGKRMYERAMFDETKDMACAILDIDDFKNINDTFGHGVGDEAIANFALRIQSEMRANDIVARFGGEEFLILFADSNAKSAAKVLRRLQRAWAAKPMETSVGTLPLTVSIGVADTTNIDENLSFIGFIEKADMALYKAKKEGKNRVELAN